MSIISGLRYPQPVFWRVMLYFFIILSEAGFNSNLFAISDEIRLQIPYHDLWQKKGFLFPIIRRGITDRKTANLYKLK
jgi:hypothetical protein